MSTHLAIVMGMKQKRSFNKQLIFSSLLIGSFAALVACAPTAGKEPLKTTPTATSQPQVKPSIYKEDGVEVVRGGVHSEGLTVNYDDATKSMTLKGQLQITPYDGGPLAVVDISLAGQATDSERINLKPLAGDKTTPPGMNVAAKATCLDEAGGCAASFIDIYIQYNDHIYHHQLETSAGTEPTKSTPYLTPIGDTKTPIKTPTIADLDKEDDIVAAERDDEDEPIEDDDDYETSQGHYIGDIRGDLKDLFNVDAKDAKPATPAASPSPSPSASPAVKAEVKPPAKTETKPAETKPKTPVAPAAPTTPAVPATPVKTEPKTEPKKEVKPTPVKPEVKPEPKQEPKQEPKPETPEKKTEPKTETKPEAKSESKGGPFTALGSLGKKIYQVMGSASRGFLKNAMSLFDFTKKEKPPGFYISRPHLKTYFGSNELIYMIQKMGSFTLGQMPDYSVRVGDLSKERGGMIYTTYKGKSVPKHRSHKSGVDADISYYFKNQKDQGQSALTSKGTPREDWLMEEQWELFKMFNETKLVDRVFIHRKLKKALCNFAITRGEITKDSNEGVAFETLWRLQPRQSDHADHFHLRVKCSSIQQGCLSMADPPRTTGCF